MKNSNYYLCLVFLLMFCSPWIYSQDEKTELRDNSEFNRSLARAGAGKIRKAEKHFRKAELTMGKAEMYDREIENIRNNSVENQHASPDPVPPVGLGHEPEKHREQY